MTWTQILNRNGIVTVNQSNRFYVIQPYLKIFKWVFKSYLFISFDKCAGWTVGRLRQPRHGGVSGHLHPNGPPRHLKLLPMACHPPRKYTWVPASPRSKFLKKFCRNWNFAPLFWDFDFVKDGPFLECNKNRLTWFYIVQLMARSQFLSPGN
jgi:hypothetical protein